MLITIGRVVLYRSRTGNYSVPAIVTATVDTLYQPNVDAGFIPGLSSDTHVHLHVMTPGTPGKRTAAAALADGDFLVKSPYGISENVNGAYTEWDIPFDTEFDPADGYDGQKAATWIWPLRA